jgi:hypothetical protein
LRTEWAQPHDAAGRESAAARARPRAEPVNDEHTSSSPDPLTAALHVTNGDCTDLAGTGLVHRSLVWFDVLHEGPVPAIDDDQSRCIRAAYLTAADPVGASEFALRRFRERDQTLDTARDGRYVLWFEADLHDQLHIVQILPRLAALGVPAERTTVICIGEHSGIAHGGGGLRLSRRCRRWGGGRGGRRSGRRFGRGPGVRDPRRSRAARRR